jgi:hypothetical protein
MRVFLRVIGPRQQNLILSAVWSLSATLLLTLIARDHVCAHFVEVSLDLASLGIRIHVRCHFCRVDAVALLFNSFITVIFLRWLCVCCWDDKLIFITWHDLRCYAWGLSAGIGVTRWGYSCFLWFMCSTGRRQGNAWSTLMSNRSKAGLKARAIGPRQSSSTSNASVDSCKSGPDRWSYICRGRTSWHP